jgi:hypothetical protein
MIELLMGGMRDKVGRGVISMTQTPVYGGGEGGP